MRPRKLEITTKQVIEGPELSPGKIKTQTFNVGRASSD
jgi:hypothetical protein